MNALPNAKRLILLVDDDALLLQFLAEVLGHAGYDTVTAASAAEAIRQIEAREPDMALLDITMPGMSGLDLARHLREHTSVPFMFLSATGDAETGKQAANYGAVGFVVKPVDAARLMPAFEASLARADEIRQLRRTEANLNAALAAGRETSLAVGPADGPLPGRPQHRVRSAARPCPLEPAQDQRGRRPVAGGRGSAQQPARRLRQPHQGEVGRRRPVAWFYRNHTKLKSAAQSRARRKCGTLAYWELKVGFPQFPRNPRPADCHPLQAPPSPCGR